MPDDDDDGGGGKETKPRFTGYTRKKCESENCIIWVYIENDRVRQSAFWYSRFHLDHDARGLRSIFLLCVSYVAVEYIKAFFCITCKKNCGVLRVKL